jgi:hypothetical protein
MSSSSAAAGEALGTHDRHTDGDALAAPRGYDRGVEPRLGPALHDAAVRELVRRLDAVAEQRAESVVFALVALGPAQQHRTLGQARRQLGAFLLAALDALHVSRQAVRGRVQADEERARLEAPRQVERYEQRRNDGQGERREYLCAE